MKTIRQAYRRIVQSWYVYYYVVRRIQRIPAKIAHALPRWLKYWVWIDVTAYVTTRPEFSSRIVPEITAVEVLDSYGKELRHK